MPSPVSAAASREAGDDRIFVDKTPEELVQPFKGMTAYQAERATAVLIGKWVVIEVAINNISARFRSGVLVSAFINDILVSMEFDGSWENRVNHFGRGDQIKVEGQIERLNQIEVHLKECRLAS